MYLVFAHDTYYPAGGTSDLICTTSDIDMAVGTAKSLVEGKMNDFGLKTSDFDFSEVYCTDTLKVIWQSDEEKKYA